jgi:hypothetical protein
MSIDARGFVSWGLWGEGGVQIMAEVDVQLTTSPEAIAVTLDADECLLTLEADEINVEIDDE